MRLTTWLDHFVQSAWRKFGNPGFVLGSGSGLALGMILCAPLFRWHLSDGASTVFGAAAGALIGAGGAGVIAVRITTRADRKAHDDVSRTLETIIAAGTEFQVSATSGTVRVMNARGLLGDLESNAQSAKSRLKLFQSSARYIEATGIVIVDALDQIERLLGHIKRERVILRSRDDHDVWGMTPPMRHAINSFNVKAAKIAEGLR